MVSLLFLGWGTYIHTCMLEESIYLSIYLETTQTLDDCEINSHYTYAW